MSESDVRRVLEQFEAAFTACLEAILALKSGAMAGDAEASFQNFQPRLYQSLLALSREYRQIATVRNLLIQRKANYSKSWFNNRQRLLARRQETLLRAIGAGRALGDAFVWFFYANDPELLEQHLAQPASLLPPTGVGGDGELALVDGVRWLGDNYILFHGITSLFRLGDASLFDFRKGRIAGIGELKTVRVDDKHLSLHFVASLRRDGPPSIRGAEPQLVQPSSKDFDGRLTATQVRRLKQQLTKISRAAAAAERPPDRKLEISTPAMSHAAALGDVVDEAMTRGFAYRQAGQGLLLVAWRSHRRSMATALNNPKASLPSAVSSGLAARVVPLTLAGSAHNCFLIDTPLNTGTKEPALVPGTTPLLWWPLQTSALRAMATGRCIVATIYNPAHLFAAFERRGFTVKRFHPPSDFALSLDDGKRQLTVENVLYFLRLVNVALLSEEHVVNQLSLATQEAGSSGQTAGRIDLRFFNHVAEVRRPPPKRQP